MDLEIRAMSGEWFGHTPASREELMRGARQRRSPRGAAKVVGRVRNYFVAWGRAGYSRGEWPAMCSAGELGVCRMGGEAFRCSGALNCPRR